MNEMTDEIRQHLTKFAESLADSLSAQVTEHLKALGFGQTQPKPPKKNQQDRIVRLLKRRGPLTSKQIAEVLGLSESTVRTWHLKRLQDKNAIQSVKSNGRRLFQVS